METSASASTDVSSFLPISNAGNTEAHILALNNIFGEIFKTLKEQKNEIEKINKEKHEIQMQYQCKLNEREEMINILKNELQQLKTSQSELKSRMVTKSDILSQEIRINQMASKIMI